MTADQRRIVIAVCVVYFLSLLMIGGLAFLITPMADDLNLKDGTVQYILAIPSVVALVVVFSAGQIASRFGSRRTIVFAGLGFSVGSFIMCAAPDALLLQVGLGICAATAMTMQIVGVGLLQKATVKGEAQVSAFTTFGMVAPLAFLTIPLATSQVLTITNWRLVPLAWVIGGIVIAIVAHRRLDPRSETLPVGEWVTPLLAGVAVAGAARAIAQLGNAEETPQLILTSVLAAVLAGTACALIVRRRQSASFSTSAIRGPMMRPMLLGVTLVTFVQLLTYVIIALQFIYEFSAVSAAVATIPAQLAGILGAKFLAKKAIKRWGSFNASRGLLLAIAVTMLPLLALTDSTPAWLLVAIATAFCFTTTAALTSFNTDVMRRSPDGATEEVSSFRAASSSVGAAICAGVFGIVILSRTPIAAGAAAITAAESADMLNGLRLAGVISACVAVAGAAMLTFMQRRATPESTSIARTA